MKRRGSSQLGTEPTTRSKRHEHEKRRGSKDGTAYCTPSHKVFTSINPVNISRILDDCYSPSTVWSVSDFETCRNAKSGYAIESPKVLPVRECTGLL